MYVHTMYINICTREAVQLEKGSTGGLSVLKITETT